MSSRVSAPKPPRRVRRAGWTKPARKQFERYVRKVQKRLGLREWKIDVDWARSPQESCAEISRWENQRRATMYVGAGFLRLSPGDQRNTVVHELVHCLLFDVHQAAELAAAELPARVAPYAMAVVNSEVEKAVDVLTGLLERGVRYPPTPSAAPGTRRKRSP